MVPYIVRMVCHTVAAARSELAYVSLQYVNVTCFVAANLYVLSGDCHWFSPFVTVMG